MYLMDSIAEIAAKVNKDSELGVHAVLSIFPILERKLQGCPRFLFDENSIKTAVELTLGRPKILREAMQYCRIPYTKMWIEWPESGRQKLRDTFDNNKEHPFRPLPKRLGFLLEADETGRKGVVTWVWNNHLLRDDEPPNVCPISAFFDLDACFEQNNAIYKNFLASNIAAMWKDSPIQLDALQSIWATSEHKPSSWGYVFIESTKKAGLGGSQRLMHFYADIYGEYIMIWSVMMLLTSSKKIINLEHVDNSKWNKARTKQGKVPKLDHTIVSLHINKEIYIHEKSLPLGFTRKSPRIHIVSSYLARRGNKHWVVQPYWRGKGEVISRHVHVKP